MAVHRNAAAKTARKPRRRREPVEVATVNPGVLATALQLVGGRAELIKIESPTVVRIIPDLRYPLLSA